ncbi:hypothetical protein M9458_053691, partial [Cirrhinus mrigala]
STDSDAAGQHTLNGAPIESGENGWRETCPFQPAKKVEALLALLVERRDVGGPVKLSIGQWGVVNRISSEVHHNLFCLTHIEGQIVSATPFSQLSHFLSVVCFIVVADEAYHSRVISEFDDVVGAELGSAVVGQQREEQWAENTALWGTCANWNGSSVFGRLDLM